MLALAVTTYVVAAAGVPIYLHYCGGMLEKVNYVLKSTSCCGGEENDSEEDSGCCKDEHILLKSSFDLTIKHNNHQDVVKTISQFFFLSLPYSVSFQTPQLMAGAHTFEAPSPPRLQNSILISTSVLRI